MKLACASLFFLPSGILSYAKDIEFLISRGVGSHRANQTICVRFDRRPDSQENGDGLVDEITFTIKEKFRQYLWLLEESSCGLFLLQFDPV